MREMKDSEVPWIGEIPKGWSTIAVKRYCVDVYAGGTPQSNNPDYWDGDIPWIPSGSCHDGIINSAPKYITQQGFDNSSTKLIPANTTVMAMTGATCANMGFVSFETCSNQSVAAFIPKANCYSKYLFYALFSVRPHILTYQTGGAQAGINIENCKNFIVPFLPFDEQCRIAAFLDAKCAEIDTVLNKTRATIEEYKKLKQSVITEAVTKGIYGDRPMKSSGVEWIGDIPEAWSVYRKLSFLCDDSISYGIIKLYDPDEQGVPVLRCSDVKAGYIDSSNIRTVSKSLSDEYKRTILKGGEIVINVRGTLGGCAIVPESMCGFNVAREVAVIRTSRVCSRYLMYYLLSDAFLAYQTINLSGSVYVGLNIEFLSSCPIVVPSEKEQKEIVTYLDEKCAVIDSLIASKEALISELENFKKSVIYEYVTGKKEVL